MASRQPQEECVVAEAESRAVAAADRLGKGEEDKVFMSKPIEKDANFANGSTLKKAEEQEVRAAETLTRSWRAAEALAELARAEKAGVVEEGGGGDSCRTLSVYLSLCACA
jgi:hypothetical protein